MCNEPVRNKSLQYKVISLAMTTVACATVTTRILYKFSTKIGLGLGDWFIVVVLLCCVPSAVINDIMLADQGLGQDIWTLRPEQITQFAAGFWAITLLYFTEVFMLKLCLLFFYLRIFPTRGMRRLLWATIVVNVLYGAAFVLAAVFQCTPISDNWLGWKSGGGKGGNCVDRSAIAWSHAVISIALDIWMLLLPISGLRKLNMSWQKKLAVSLMFLVGTLTTVVSIVRLSSLLLFKYSENLTWDYYDVCMWSSVEVTTGVICACMPALRKMLVAVWPKLDGTLRLRNPLYIVRDTPQGDSSKSGRSKGGSSTQRSAATAAAMTPRSQSGRGGTSETRSVLFSKADRDLLDIELDDVERLVGRAEANPLDRHDTAASISVHTNHSREGAGGERPVTPHVP